MNSLKARLTTLVLVLVLALSGASYGFLIGRSHQLDTSKASEQIHQASEQIRTSGAVLNKGAELVKRLLVK
jgi:hypothetical protein